MKIISKILLLSSGIAMLGLGACKKSYLNRTPTTQKSISDVFKTTTGCKQALEGIHSLMYQATGPTSFGQKSIDLINDVMGDDMPFEGFGAGWFVFYANYQNAQQGDAYIWTYYYNMINNCNEILDHVDSATGPESDKKNIKGQVYFYLAFAYYNLSIYYQHTYMYSLGPITDSTALGVPIYHHVTQQGNPRAPLDTVYQEIINDLRMSEKLLNPATGGTATVGNLSEIHLDAAYGLHARVALVMQRWKLADSMAGAARLNHPYMSASQLLQGFNSMQNGAWIWGSHLTEEATNFVESFISQMDINANGYAALGQQKEILKFLYQKLPDGSDSTQGFDIRRDWWFDKDTGNYKQYSQNKFRVITPGSFSLDVCYMRAAEMGLIQAEAETQMGDYTTAENTLNELIQIRNPKYNVDSVIAHTTTYHASIDTTITFKAKLLVQIWFQRRVELWGEGFRYSDLQRCAAIKAAVFSNDNQGYLYYQGLHRGFTFANGDNTIYGSATNYSSVDNRFLFRIPGTEINSNPNMIQNP